MTTQVNGPDDVKPGDLVRFDAGDGFRQKFVIATVLRVNPSTLTVRLPDGSTLRKAYEVTKTSRTFHRTERIKTRSFRRLDAWDRWYEARPSGAIVAPTFGAGMRVVSVVVMAPEVRDRPDEVCAQLRAVSAWLKVEPSKETP